MEIFPFLYLLLPLCYIPPFHCRGVSLIGSLFMKLNSWPDELVTFLSRLSSHRPDGRGQFPNRIVWCEHFTPLAVLVFCTSSFGNARRVRCATISLEDDVHDIERYLFQPASDPRRTPILRFQMRWLHLCLIYYLIGLREGLRKVLFKEKVPLL